MRTASDSCSISEESRGGTEQQGDQSSGIAMPVHCWLMVACLVCRPLLKGVQPLLHAGIALGAPELHPLPVEARGQHPLDVAASSAVRRHCGNVSRRGAFCPAAPCRMMGEDAWKRIAGNPEEPLLYLMYCRSTRLGWSPPSIQGESGCFARAASTLRKAAKA